jgi:hypothetical protein
MTYTPSAASLKHLYGIVQKVAEATPITKKFVKPPKILAKLWSGKIFFDSALELDYVPQERTSITSADKSVWGSTARRILAQADRSNIHAGISSQRFASDAVRSQRKTTPPGLSIAS